MMAKSWCWLLLSIMTSALQLAHAEVVLAIDTNEERGLNLSQWAYYTNDIPELNIQQVSRLSSSRWQKLTPDVTNHVGKPAYWVKFTLYNQTPDIVRRFISIENPHIDKLDLYHLVNDTLYKQIAMGDSLPFDQRPIINNNFLYPFELSQDQMHSFYIRVETQGSANLPLNLYSPNELAKRTEAQSLTHGFQLGALTAIGLFSLFIAITTGSFSYSYYSGYVLSVTLLVATLHGFAFRFLWPNWPHVQQLMLLLLIPLTIMFALLFTEKVLQLKYHGVRLLRMCRYGAAIAALMVIITPFLDYSVALVSYISAVLISSVLLMVIAIIQSLKGHKLAKLFTLAWSGLLVGSFITASMYLGLLHLPIAHQTPLMMGLSFEIVFMAAILAIRYNDERKAKMRIQQEALKQAEHLRQSREESLRMEAQSNEKLEQMVQERTLELEIALRELNEANQKLTEQTTIDSLTGVKNRAAFDKRLQAEGRLSRRQQTPMAILMLDIDRFKSINDNHGHLAGDQCLRLIAQALKAKLKRPADLVSRFGGEEFAIILPNTAQDGALQVAESIREAIDELPLSWDNQTIPLTVSIGVCAEVVEDEDHTQLLLDHADKALYQAKNEGRNKVVLFGSEEE
ncbi:diguanylate cyclase [Shewanella sp. Scap07]|uniref:sensor domain-containing diguanylate cyclase n=1 Tax=Shewanella sp. Scap07 TaxID=2589987 RepID=UPI00356AED90